MTQEEIIYKYHLNYNTKRRNEAIGLLEKRDFVALSNKYIHWFDRKEKITELKSTLISDVIKELAEIKVQDNESEPNLSCCNELDDSQFVYDESKIKVYSYIYTIVPFEKCESLAKNYANDSLWKLKHQPNGKEAEACRKILNLNV